MPSPKTPPETTWDYNQNKVNRRAKNIANALHADASASKAQVADQFVRVGEEQTNLNNIYAKLKELENASRGTPELELLADKLQRMDKKLDELSEFVRVHLPGNRGEQALIANKIATIKQSMDQFTEQSKHEKADIESTLNAVLDELREHNEMIAHIDSLSDDHKRTQQITQPLSYDRTQHATEFIDEYYDTDEDEPAKTEYLTQFLDDAIPTEGNEDNADN
ncbi:MAG: hypothetical protein CL678_01035 [Bdellovibrionaceae bacterium]|nr:hypothetical protein [Pseudobdellovibrionaceae bacterium]